MLVLTAFAAILFSGSLSIGVQTSYAQLQPSPSQEQEQQQEGEEPEVASDGGLTATLNGESFRRGDTVVISGTVEERESGSTVYARVFDPDSIELDIEGIHVNADGTFRHGFVAGEDSTNDGTSDPMTKSGTYTITLEYFPPGNADTDTTEVSFEYDHTTTSTSQGATLPSTIFQSNVDGFRVGVPEGWIVEDTDNTDPINQQRERSFGAGQLALICPQAQASPVIGGGNVCPIEVENGVAIFRFADLKSRPEFASVVQANQNITISDLVAYYIQFTERQFGYTNIRLLESIDTTVNVTDPQTNQTIATAPAKYAEYTFLDGQGLRNERDFILLVLSNDGNTGYFLQPFLTSIMRPEVLPPEQQLAFNTFGLVAANSTI